MSLDVPRPKGYRKAWHRGPDHTKAHMALDLAWAAYLHFAPAEQRTIRRKEDMSQHAQEVWLRIDLPVGARNDGAAANGVIDRLPGNAMKPRKFATAHQLLS